MNLSLEVLDINECIVNPTVMGMLTAMTMHDDSGMNRCLRKYQADFVSRDISAKAIVAYADVVPVGWALWSQEGSDSWLISFDRLDGVFVQVFVKPEYRRLGIGTALVNKARQLANGVPLCVSCWSKESWSFFDRVIAERQRRYEFCL